MGHRTRSMVDALAENRAVKATTRRLISDQRFGNLASYWSRATGQRCTAWLVKGMERRDVARITGLGLRGKLVGVYGPTGMLELVVHHSRYGQVCDALFGLPDGCGAWEARQAIADHIWHQAGKTGPAPRVGHRFLSVVDDGYVVAR